MRIAIFAAAVAALLFFAWPAFAVDPPATAATAGSVPVAPPAALPVNASSDFQSRLPRVWHLLHPFHGRLQCRVAYAVRHGRWLRWAVIGR